MLVGLKETTGATPVPVSESLPFTVPRILRVPERAPAADGVKVRLTVHVALGAIVPPFAHVPVPAFAKLLELVPVMVKYGVESVSVAVPVFVTVRVKGPLVVLTFWFPNAPGLGVTLIAACVPVPVRESEALTVPRRFRVALRAPAAAGVNRRLIVQEPLAVIKPPFAHVPVPRFVKSVELVPVIVKYGLASVSVAVPVFVTVTVSGELGVLTTWFPKAAGLGERPMTGRVPVPVNPSVAKIVP